MRKKICYLGVLAVVLASCATKEPLVPETPEVVPEAKADSVLLDFGAYVNRGIATKAGAVGELSYNNGGTQLIDTGFGVFAYYNNGELYNDMARPDFMYNQLLSYDGANWVYSPLRYWPNEFGSNAESEEVDRLTFFAYAPWVKVTPSTGILLGYDDSTPEQSTATGIIGMSRNTASGSPLIKYASSLNAANCVDLCWGVAADAFNSSVDGDNNSVAAGKPFIDLIKPKVGDKIKFDFKHALAALNVQIDAVMDAERNDESDELDSFTHIYVRSITFEGFTTKGALDLNSEYSAASPTPNWFDLAGTGKLSLDPITIYDGRRDGKEGVASAVAKNETPAELNPVIVQDGAYTTTDDGFQFTSVLGSEIGVQKTAVNLFRSSGVTSPVYVIPTEETIKVTIVYDVETADNTLPGYLADGATHGTSVENAITKEITLASGDPMKLDAGKRYTIKLHLGLTSVKFDATVSAWEDDDNPGEPDLPYNTETRIGYNSTLNYDASAADISFLMSGLTNGSTVTVTSTPDLTVTPNYLNESGKVNASGRVKFSASLPANDSGAEKSYVLTITENLQAGGTKVSTITLTQGTEVIAALGENKTLTAGAEAATVSFVLSGLADGATLTPTSSDIDPATVTIGSISGGKATVSFPVSLNTTGEEKNTLVTISDGSSSSDITVKQAPVSYAVSGDTDLPVDYPESLSPDACTVAFELTGLKENRKLDLNDTKCVWPDGKTKDQIISAYEIITSEGSDNIIDADGKAIVKVSFRARGLSATSPRETTIGFTQYGGSALTSEKQHTQVKYIQSGR